MISIVRTSVPPRFSKYYACLPDGTFLFVGFGTAAAASCGALWFKLKSSANSANVAARDLKLSKAKDPSVA
jgi:hypothetical protein